MTQPSGDFPAMLDAITGRVIVGGELTDDGMHINLDDGRILIFDGDFIVGLAQINRKALQ